MSMMKCKSITLDVEEFALLELLVEFCNLVVKFEIVTTVYVVFVYLA